MIVRSRVQSFLLCVLANPRGLLVARLRMQVRHRRLTEFHRE